MLLLMLSSRLANLCLRNCWGVDRGGGIEKRQEKSMDTDSSVGIAKERRMERAKERYTGIKGKGRYLTGRGEHAIQYTDDVL